MSVECVGKPPMSVQNSPIRSFNLRNLSGVLEKSHQNPRNHSKALNRASTGKVRSASRVLFNENDRSRISSKEKPPKNTNFVLSTVLTENNFIYNFSTEESSSRPGSALHKTSDSFSQAAFSPQSSASPQAINKKDFSKFEKSPIRFSVTKYDKIVSLNFDSAFQRFKSLKHELLSKKLWKISFFKKIRRCWTHTRLEDENLDAAEKIIKFAFTKHNPNDFFHLSLVQGAQDTLASLVPSYTSSFKLKKVDCKYPLIALMNLLFLNDFFRTQLEAFVLEFESVHKAVKVLFWVSDAAVIALRKEKLNKVINQCGKCFEVFCFFYAGLVMNARACGDKVLKCSSRKRVYGRVLKSVRNQVFETVKLAEEMYE